MGLRRVEGALLALLLGGLPSQECRAMEPIQGGARQGPPTSNASLQATASELSLRLPGGKWAGWAIPKPLRPLSDPAAVWTGPSAFAAFAVDKAGRLQRATVSGPGAEPAWAPLEVWGPEEGPFAPVRPAALAAGTGALHLFARLREPHDGLVYRRLAPGADGSWERLPRAPHPPASGLSAAAGTRSREPLPAHVFVVSSANTLDHLSAGSGRWESWTPPPGVLLSGDPAAVASADGARLDVFVADLDFRLWWAAACGSGAPSWRLLGFPHGNLVSPSAARVGERSLLVEVMAGDGWAWHLLLDSAPPYGGEACEPLPPGAPWRRIDEPPGNGTTALAGAPF
jgi:hypothetical protein